MIGRLLSWWRNRNARALQRSLHQLEESREMALEALRLGLIDGSDMCRWNREIDRVRTELLVTQTHVIGE